MPYWLDFVMKRLGAIAVLCVFVAALYVLHRELAHVNLHEVMASFRAISTGAFTLALTFVVASYVVLTGYDFMGVHYAGRKLRVAQVAVTSFIAYAVGHNVGLAMLSGGAVRYRLYSRVGLSAFEIGKVIAACTLTFGLGVSGVFALVCAFAPGDVTVMLPVSSALVRSVGVAMLLLLAAYTVVNAVRRRPIKIRGVLIPLPGLRMTVIQFLLAGVDLTLASAVLYVLLPQGANVPFAAFLGLYSVATVVAILSHVPGGIGVFEAVLVSMLPGIAAHDLLASILAYRALYYLLPLAISAVLLVGHELRTYFEHLAGLKKHTGAMLGGVAPLALGVLVFVFGGYTH